MNKCEYYYEKEVLFAPPHPYMKHKKVIGMCGVSAINTKCMYNGDATKCNCCLNIKTSTKEE